MKLGLKRLSEAKKWYIKFAVVEGLGEQKWSIFQGRSDEQSAFYILLVLQFIIIWQQDTKWIGKAPPAWSTHHIRVRECF
jgi:hypothetical protein